MLKVVFLVPDIPFLWFTSYFSYSINWDIPKLGLFLSDPAKGYVRECGAYVMGVGCGVGTTMFERHRGSMGQARLLFRENDFSGEFLSPTAVSPGPSTMLGTH